jgi:AcrR family transcriptional regulator
MTSLRNTRGSRDGYLDAARACILDVGWRRTTLTEVARRAGVSRMTIYRTWPDMQSLMADLMTREWSSLVEEIEVGSARPDRSAAALLADAVVAGCRGLRDNELFVRIVELDPELLLPYLLSRRGRSQQAIVTRLADLIALGQADGQLREGDPVAIGRSVVLAAHGFCLSAHTMIDDDVSLDDLDDELRLLIARMLEPA